VTYVHVLMLMLRELNLKQEEARSIETAEMKFFM
jgi:hypothetical protein